MQQLRASLHLGGFGVPKFEESGTGDAVLLEQSLNEAAARAELTTVALEAADSIAALHAFLKGEVMPKSASVQGEDRQLQQQLVELETLASDAAASFVESRQRGSADEVQLRSLADALAETHMTDADPQGSPIHNSLTQMGEYVSASMRLRYASPADMESLETRLWQRDIAKGCIDPDLIGTARDVCEFDVGGLSFRLPCFLAHLASARDLLTQLGDDADQDEGEGGGAAGGKGGKGGGEGGEGGGEGGEGGEGGGEGSSPSAAGADSKLSALWADGTWTGTLVWDSAVHACEHLLASEVWVARLCAVGATVVELGSGLGLPGLTCHAMGASRVLITDRDVVASLVGEGLALSHVEPSAVRALSLPWSAEGACNLMSTHLGGAPPTAILACDCIFAPLFGSAYLLLQMLDHLAGDETAILLALERRPNDGADAFFVQAEAVGFTTALRVRKERVLVCEMKRRTPPHVAAAPRSR